MEVKTNWQEIINKYDKGQLMKFEQFIINETTKFSGFLNIYPKKEKIFRCFNYFDIDDTKIVIIGQDPYHGPNQATGLCFDIDEESGCKYPPSLKNIEKVLGKKPNFEEWAKKGVLLLNASLSVLQSKAGSHLNYWMPFTKYIINILNQKCDNLIFIVWGAFALDLVKDVDKNKHKIYISSHPSPFSYSKKLRNYPSFEESNIFNKITEINW
tara:strand:+ start:507 stop:1142 length:636 start_codon:yes stop_codon:yes gene_type:complete